MYFCEHSLSLAFEPSRHLRSQAQRDLLVCSISYLEYFNLLRPPLLEGVRARARYSLKQGRRKLLSKRKRKLVEIQENMLFNLSKKSNIAKFVSKLARTGEISVRILSKAMLKITIFNLHIMLKFARAVKHF